MSWTRAIRAVLVTCATAGLTLPGEVLRGSEPERTAAVVDPQIPDVQLDAAGQLHGVVVDGQGHPMPETRVMLSRVGEVPNRVSMTDAKGQFRLAALKGGAYQLHTSEGVCVCRAWTAKAAPPGAARSLLVVNDRLVERGQRPVRDLFTSDPVLVATLVAAVIAIPIAIHKSQDDAPPGS